MTRGGQMKRVILAGAFAFVAAAFAAHFFAGASPAAADGGPHVVETGATPDKCAACHRLHTGQNDSLLKSGSTIEQFCYSCHGTTGTGSKLSVQNGTYYGTLDRSNPQSSVGLRGGGFEEARINTTDPSPDQIGVLSSPQPVTSRHTTDGTTAGTLWGNGAIGSGPGPAFTLSCTTCHDPHGNGQFRILRPIPTGSGAAAVSVPDQADPKTYTVTDYMQMGGAVSKTTMSSWCATCHTRYLASSSPPVDSGDPIFRFRHRSDGNSNRACITCHASHGTNANASGPYSSSVDYPGGGSGSTRTQETRLLKMDNRGICVKCHLGY